MLIGKNHNEKSEKLVAVVKFIQTKDDIIAFSQYSLDQNKSIHRVRIIGLGGSIILPLSVFFFMVFIFKMPREAFTWPPITIFICAVLLFSIYGFQKYAVKSRFLKNAVKKAMKGRDHTRAFGPIEITIDKNGLHHKNEFTDERVNWDGIIKIIDK